MSVSGATLSAPGHTSIPDQTTPKLSYEHVDGGFYYTVAHSARGSTFVSLPGFTAAQVQELIEDKKSFFPPENFDGNESFGFAHGWQVGSNKVGIVAEDGVLCCTVYDEAGAAIHDEEIPQIDCKGKPLPAGEIYCRYLQSISFVDSDGKSRFLYYVGEATSTLTWVDKIFSCLHPTWVWEDKTLSLLENDGLLMWELFDRATGTKHCIAFANTFLENPDNNFYEERFYNELPHEDCPVFLLGQERVNVGQLLDCASVENKVLLTRRIAELIQTYSLKVWGTAIHQIQYLSFRPSKAYISIQSRLDRKITVDASHYAITLVNSKAPSPKWPFGHAILLIEKVNKHHQYKMMRADLTVEGGWRAAITGIHPGIVRYVQIPDPESFSYDSKTETWSLPRDRVKLMIYEIKKAIRMQSQEGTDNPVFFCGPGHGTIFTPKFFQTNLGPRRVENCLSWSVKKLLSCGAEFYHLPEGVFMNRPAAYISSYASDCERAKRSQGEEIMRVQRIFGIDRRTEIPVRPLQDRTSLRYRFVRNMLGFRHLPLMSHGPLQEILIGRMGELIQRFFPTLETDLETLYQLSQRVKIGLVFYAFFSSSYEDKKKHSKGIRDLLMSRDPETARIAKAQFSFYFPTTSMERFIENQRFS